ncbi:titin-like isoform X2 [Xiphophorus maculatus]|uniref:titin-like isoform X2 n=1 Tax=Xiphophorus maculatus TaxID=8083 RepID=UPI000C6D936E|nr:titin-like isoform X2 [Xiphophorus maculatus]
MKPALLCMLGFFLLSSLLHGRADADKTIQPVDVTDPDTNKPPAEIKATLAADETTVPPGGSVTLTCSVDKPADLTFELFREPPPTYQTRVSPRSDGVFIITEGGIYTCRGFKTEHNFMTSMSDEVIIQETEIKATLKADKTTIPPGGSVTLTCSVDKPADLTFELFRESSSTDQTRVSPRSDGVFRITEGGIYICIGFKPGTNFVSAISDEVTINERVSNRVSVTSQPNRSLIYRGEKVTLRCEIQDDGGTEWTYEWKTTNRNSPSSSEFRIITATQADSGEYSCKGRRGYEFTGWSEAIRLTVSSDKPRATLKAEKRIIPAGGSVTLNCSVEGSTGWEFRYTFTYYSVVGSSRNTEPDGTIRVSEGGEFSCRGRRGDSSFESETSEEVTIQKTVSKPTVILRPRWSLNEEDNVYLECEIQKRAQWTYEWRKNNFNYNPAPRIITANSGDYSCKGTSDYLLTQWSDVITLTISPNKPSLILQPNWSQIYRGEKVTLRCEIQGGTEWTYEWRSTNGNFPSSSEYSIISATEYHSGKYSCRGKRGFSFTPWSNVVKITVSFPPQPVLSVSPSWPNPGASVTLSCEGLELQSAGWRFFWYKVVPDPPSNSYSIELLPGSTNGTEQNSFIINGPTHTAEFLCRAGREEPKFYTNYSKPKFVWSADPRPAASLSVNPDRVQHFRSDSVSLSCEGNSAEWRVRRFIENYRLLYFTCSYWGKMTGSTCTIDPYWLNSGVFWCESKSGEFSNAVNITVQEAFQLSCAAVLDARMKPALLCMLGFFLLSSLLHGRADADKPRATLTPETRIIPAGGSITLNCSVEGSTGWEFYWIRSGHHCSVVLFSRNTEPEGTIRVSEGGKYICRGRRRGDYFESETSEEVTIQNTVSKPTVIQQPGWSLNEDKVYLECDIQKRAQWTYEWRKNNFNYNPTPRIITADSGDYSCKGTSDYLLTQWSDVITLTISPNKPSLILQPNWSQIYIGEKVTLRCEIQGGTEWTYEWRPTNRNFPPSSEYSIISATESHSGEYSCRGKRGFSFTPWSNVVKITVSVPPQPVLSVSPSWPNPGASVTLSCEGLKHQSEGWRFFWYKTVPDPSSRYYSIELLPGSTNGTEQNSFIINGPTHTGRFVCRAERGEPKFYTNYSKSKFVWSADPRPAASLSVNPDRVQHFRYDSVSLSCEGNSTEWRVMRIIEREGLSDFTCSYWGKMTGSTCTINPYYYMDGVFWCESKSGEFSNAVNITAQDDNHDGVILVSPVHPVTEGDPVTLSCRDKKQNLLSNVFFYHNDKLINNDGREELNISAVSKSDEGFYKCQHSGKESPRSWMSVRVTVSSPVSSSFPVMLIVGPVVGIVLIILIIVLLLLWRRRRSKDLSSNRLNQPESINPASATNHEVTQNDGSVYSSLLHGDTSLYETIQLSRASGNAEKIYHPAEDTDYANAKPGKRNVMVRSPSGLVQGKGNAS